MRGASTSQNRLHEDEAQQQQVGNRRRGGRRGLEQAPTRPSLCAGRDRGQDIPQIQLLRKTAAVQIQKKWRAHHKYKTDNKDRTDRRRRAATKIQAVWRAFHVRHLKVTKVATIIQKWVRGFLVRNMKRVHKAAVVIQRRTMGHVVRRCLARKNAAALKLQCVARGAIARSNTRAHREKLIWTAMILQRACRRWKALKVAGELRRAKQAEEQRKSAALSIQKIHRGSVCRKRAILQKVGFINRLKMRSAVTQVQCAVRRWQAIQYTERLRVTRLNTLNRAATTIRKHWLCYLYWSRYISLRHEFTSHVDSIVTIQRYVRGFLVRLRLWRKAIREEEELWGAIEIQRNWRGYLGRLRWELEYEAVWSREVAANRVQRAVRGWLARTCVHRLRKRLARAEFERARMRFKAAQKIQALARGHLVRRRIAIWRKWIVGAALRVQRVWRGHRYRNSLWTMVLDQRATHIQATIRGYLVRNRRFHLLAKIIMIQQFYRRWLRCQSEAQRQKRLDERQAKLAALA